MGIFKVLVVNRGSPPMKNFFLCIFAWIRTCKNFFLKVEKMKKVCPDPPPCWENSQLFFFRMNPSLKATHNLEFSAVLVFPDSSITLDTRMSNLDICMSMLNIRVSRLDIRVSVPTILVLILAFRLQSFE